MNDNDANRWSNVHRAKAAARKAKRTQPGGAPSSSPENAQATLSEIRGTALSPVPLRNDLVTVSIVAGDSAPIMLERATRSILHGTHQHVRVLIFEDGSAGQRDQIDKDVREDPRVSFVRTAFDHGPFFVHDAVVRSRPHGLFAVQDPTDTSVPDRLHRQLAALFQTRADAVLSPVIDIAPDGAARITPCSTSIHPLYGHHADHFGVFNGASVSRMGGYFAGFRTGFDLLMTSLMCITGRVAVTRDALYRRFGRPAGEQELRGPEHADLDAVYTKVYRAAQKSPLSAVQQFSEIVRARTAAYASDTRALVAQIQRACPPLVPPPACDALLNSVLRAAPSSGDVIADALARHLYRYCESCRPRQVLDIGSGVATFVLALYAGRNPDARVVSVQSDPARHAKVSEALERAGLREAIDLRLAPLRRVEGRPRGYLWYDTDLCGLFPGGVDFVFVDGPDDVQSPARDGAVLELSNIMRPGAKVWLHDGCLPTSIETVGLWREKRQIEANLVTTHDRAGVWELAMR